MRKALLPLVILFLLLTVMPVLAYEKRESMPNLQKMESERAQLMLDKQRLMDERKNLLASREGELKRLAADRLMMSTKAAELRSQFEARVKAFKDQNKANLAIRINNNLDTVNTNATNQMLKNLDHMATLSGRINNRIASASAEGKNTASASAALSTANTAIANAKSAVQAQAAKTYTVTFTDESTIGHDIKNARNKLLTDLKATRQMVLDARMALVKAAQAVAGL